MSSEERKYQEAKGRVREIRGFYTHLAVYVLVNTFLFLLDITLSPDVLWFYWPLLGWGIAIVVHAVSVFGFGPWLGQEWEEKKIDEYMDRV